LGQHAIESPRVDEIIDRAIEILNAAP